MASASMPPTSFRVLLFADARAAAGRSSVSVEVPTETAEDWEAMGGRVGRRREEPSLLTTLEENEGSASSANCSLYPARSLRGEELEGDGRRGASVTKRRQQRATSDKADECEVRDVEERQQRTAAVLPRSGGGGQSDKSLIGVPALELWRLLGEQYPFLLPVLSSSQLAVNLAFCDVASKQLIFPGDEIAVIPSVTGG